MHVQNVGTYEHLVTFCPIRDTIPYKIVYLGKRLVTELFTLVAI